MKTKDYVVKAIVDCRRNGHQIEYLVEWAPTWEVDSDLNCQQLIDEFNSSRNNNLLANNGSNEDIEDNNKSMRQFMTKNTDLKSKPMKRKFNEMHDKHVSARVGGYMKNHCIVM
ncbi:uncharacterized protein LOC128966431 [Oppia nitens]|uniref:uncharacterized protein LOC128966431 n=1 Tax=Oppia nitens TaxID=1686743 RepID=UPI0023DA85C1|nr:uncharacterized protein LOC128966431 [Oppia nitens]